MDQEAESAAMIAAALEDDYRVILVDGFNVLHAVLLGKDREGWWKRAPRERLLERVSRWRGEADQIWVAFDGDQPAMSTWAEPLIRASQPSGKTSGSTSGNTSGKTYDAPSAPLSRTGPTVHILFVESADDWIVRRARRTERPDRMVVVSADQKVAGRARSADCEVWSPWIFMGGCGNPDREPSDTFEPSGTERSEPEVQ